MTQFKDGFIISPNPLWRPCYRISPFNTSFVRKNHEILKTGKIDDRLLKSFFGEWYIPFQSGRLAINSALSQFELQREDEIWITTTTGNKYISSCVTTEIEKFCQWSRKKSGKTKIIFVNHEFGTCYRDLDKLKEYGLPIIEDRALSFNSRDERFQTGKIGDFVIYSLPKYFPVSFGGILQVNNLAYFKSGQPDKELNFYFSTLLSHYLKEIDNINSQRKKNYFYLKDRFDEINFTPRFIYSQYEVPGVFMFKTHSIDLNKLKRFMQENGVESSIFYDEEAFFFPVHQHLETQDLDFFYTLVEYFKQNGDR